VRITKRFSLGDGIRIRTVNGAALPVTTVKLPANNFVWNINVFTGRGSSGSKKLFLVLLYIKKIMVNAASEQRERSTSHAVVTDGRNSYSC
jgi:hypothetical protein